MADVTFTAGSVLQGTGAQTVDGVLGGTITQGLFVYLDATTNTYKAADATTSIATAAAVGVSLTSGASGQPCVVQTGGNLTCDGLTANTFYCLSVSGKLCPVADFAPTTDYGTFLGYALSTTSLKLGILVTNTGKTG